MSKFFWVLVSIFGFFGLFVLYFINAIDNSTNYDYAQNAPNTLINYRQNDINQTPNTFHGYQCTEDCSGHEAGYSWAEENNITDPDECDGNSESFIEGCRAYAEENYEDENDDEYYDEVEDPYYDIQY